MATPYFQFKQFTIWHDKCAMKVGTDGVLLGAWAEVPELSSCKEKRRVLDVGTGSGLIALMLAQRFPVLIDGIDIDESAVMQAKENVKNSPFAERISIYKHDFACMQYDFAANKMNCNQKYDLIVSNPPFYVEDTISGNGTRDAARHTSSLPFIDLIHNASSMLTDEGLFTVIIPAVAASDFISLCVMKRLYLRRRLDIRTTETKEPKRTMLEFSRKITDTNSYVLSLRNKNNELSEEYKALTKDFYL